MSQIRERAYANADRRRKGPRRLTITVDECFACGSQDVLGHHRSGDIDGALFWSCADCDFTWPQITSSGF